MLKRLTVSNLAIVEKAEASFTAGLNVLTGETGAGKSVLMGALGLVLGGRADPSVVRDGAKEAEVEAEFDDVLIRRTVTATGRSRAWIDDESVTVAELKELGTRLVDIHGPRSNQLILEERFQRDTLDAFGGSLALAARYATAYAKMCDIRARLEALRGGGDAAEEADLLRYQVDELSGAELTEDDENIAERHAAAAHAEEIVALANGITEALGGDVGAAETLARLQPQFHALARHLPVAEDWAREADELTLRMQELSRSVADSASRLDAAGEDLEELDRRLTVVNRLKRKYLDRERASGGIAPDTPTVAGLLDILERKRNRLDEIEHRGERIAELEGQLAAVTETVRQRGAELTRKRRAAGDRLAKAVTRELRDLGFLQAKFAVALDPVEPMPNGCDRVAYMFEPNPGEAARPLAAIASSGEIARVMLALKGVLAVHDGVGTLVFDEIDANVGGEIGRVVGEKMQAVASHRQVIAITHLPQCAACGDRHLVVEKTVSGGRTRTGISEVSGEARISEIVRMLGGRNTTETVRKHAEELLGLSR